MGRVVSEAPARRRPTIRAVAEHASVSQTTVSFVINNKPGAAISAATRKRVWEAVEALDYRPNHAARSLSTRRSSLIGYLSDPVASGSDGVQSVRGAQAIAWSKGRLLLVVDTNADASIRTAAIDRLLSRQIEGLLIGASSLRVVRPPVVLADLPTVLVNCFDADGRFPCVVADERGGGYSATRHLTETGHRRIGLVRGAPDCEAGRRRRDGYHAALADAGLARDPKLEATTNWFPDGGRKGAAMLLDGPEPPTALFCISDWIALGVFQEVQKRGMRIPDDVAIIEYQNQDFGAHLQPSLTTVALPHEQIGRRAAELLMSGRPDGPLANVVEIPCPLVERESC